MPRFVVGLPLALLCACPSPQQTATNEGLFGFWRPQDGEDTIFAFAAASDAEELFNLSGNGLEPQTKPVGAVYQRDALVQLTSFEATPTALTQTVLADTENPPGTRFSTRIDGFERGVSMLLESKKNGGASRLWNAYDFCPRSKDYGWGQVQVTACPNSLTTGGSAAYDKQGRLYVYTGSGLAPGTSCPPAPGFLEVSRGCGTAQFEAPNGRASASRVHDDEVLRIAFVPLDSSLRVRERPIGAADFAETTLLPTTRSTALWLFDQRGPLLVTGELGPGGDAQVFRRTEQGWQGAALKRRSTGQPMTLGQVAIDGAARLWVASGAELWVERENDFELLPTRAPAAVQSLYLDPEGAPHVLVATARGLEYAVLRDGAWERHVIDASASGVIVTHGTTPYRVLTTAPAFRNPNGEVTPWRHPALITIHENGRLESELTGGPYNPIAGVSTTFAAVGPRGEVAASLTGEVVMTRSIKGRLHPTPKKLELQIDGPALRVSSADGRISCERTCTVDATLGERLAFTVEKKPGVLATLPSCDRTSRPASAPCWFSVVPPMNASTLEQNAVFKVATRATPLRDAFAASNNQGLATTLGVSGDWVAVGALFSGNATSFLLDDVDVPVTGSFESQGLVLVNRGSKQSVFVAVPRGVVIDRVLPDGQGGLFAVVSTSNQAVAIGGVTLGASQTSVTSFVHVTADGLIDRSATLASSPRNSPLVVIAGLGADGSAAAVVSGSGPLTSLNVTESNALVRLSAEGNRTAHGFSGPLASGGQLFVVDVDRVLFAVNTATDSTLFGWRAGQLDRLAMPGATARALHADPSGAVVAFSSAADLTIGGRTLSGRRHVLAVDSSLAITAAFSLATATTATWSWGVGLVPEGVGFLSGGELQWLSPSLTPLRAALPLPTTTTRVSGAATPSMSVAQGSLWILARPDQDFGGVTGAIAVAQLGVF